MSAMDQGVLGPAGLTQPIYPFLWKNEATSLIKDMCIQVTSPTHNVSLYFLMWLKTTRIWIHNPPMTVCIIKDPPKKIPISFKLVCHSFLTSRDLTVVSIMSTDPLLWVVTHIDTSKRSVWVQALNFRSAAKPIRKTLVNFSGKYLGYLYIYIYIHCCYTKLCLLLENLSLIQVSMQVLHKISTCIYFFNSLIFSFIF